MRRVVAAVREQEDDGSLVQLRARFVSFALTNLGCASWHALCEIVGRIHGWRGGLAASRRGSGRDPPSSCSWRPGVWQTPRCIDMSGVSKSSIAAGRKSDVKPLDSPSLGVGSDLPLKSRVRPPLCA